MSFAASIARTIKRLMVGGRVMEGVTWLPKLYEGLSKEFERVIDVKDTVLNTTVPHDLSPEDTLDDLEHKYGIENYSTSGLTATQRRARIIGKATRGGSGGTDWLEGIIQQEGFDLYVITDDSTAPDTVPGELIVSSPPDDAGIVYATQYDTSVQYAAPPGTSATQYGSRLFEDELNPRALTYDKPVAAKQFLYYLSPFADRLAVAGELLSVTDEELRYLRRLVISSKYIRDWCIVQVEVT